MRAARTIGIARGIDQRAAERLGGNKDLERNRLWGDDGLLAPGDPAIERPVESDGVSLEVVPSDVNFALGTNEGHGADSLPRAARVIDAGRGERQATIGGTSHVNSSCARAA